MNNPKIKLKKEIPFTVSSCYLHFHILQLVTRGQPQPENIKWYIFCVRESASTNTQEFTSFTFYIIVCEYNCSILSLVIGNNLSILIKIYIFYKLNLIVGMYVLKK